MMSKEELLREIIQNQRYVVAGSIDKTIKQYEMNKDNFDRNPMKFVRMLKTMLGPLMAENVAEIYYDMLDQQKAT